LTYLVLLFMILNTKFKALTGAIRQVQAKEWSINFMLQID